MYFYKSLFVYIYVFERKRYIKIDIKKYIHIIFWFSTHDVYIFLEYFIKEASIRNLKVHAWINPFRISNYSDISKISKDNPAYTLLNTNHISITDNNIMISTEFYITNCTINYFIVRAFCRAG